MAGKPIPILRLLRRTASAVVIAILLDALRKVSLRRSSILVVLALVGTFAVADAAFARQRAVVDTLRIAFQDGLAPTADYAGTRDTKLRSDAPNSAFGSSDFLEVDAGPDYAALIAWDLSAIPDSATVLEATLVFHVTDSSTASYQLYPLAAAWDETESTWQERMTGIPWAVPGADGATDRGGLSLSDVTSPGRGQVRIPMGASGLAVIQDWVSDPASNFGFVIQNFDTADDGLDLASREAVDPAHRPRLEVAYSVGPPTYFPDPPTALFDLVNERGFGTAIVSVDARASDVPGTAIDAWQWDFGDGGLDSGIQATHTYTQPGTYEVSLTVVDTLGVQHAASKIVIVDDGEHAEAAFQQGVFPLPSYEGAADTKLQADEATRNFGEDVSLFVDGSPFYSTLMRWDLTAIAPGIEVTAATLTFDVVDPTSNEYQIYPLEASWSESEATWENAFVGVPWASAGAAIEGDLLGQPLGTLTGGENGQNIIEFNDNGRAWLATWINNPGSNHGFVIQNFVDAEDGLDFRSSEAPDSLLRPRLDLTYRIAHHVNLPERVEFGAWPNPFRDQVNVRIDSDLRHPVDLEIYDMLGRRVLEQTVDPTTFARVRLDTSFLAAGVYALILTEHGTRVSTTRMVVRQ